MFIAKSFPPFFRARSVLQFGFLFFTTSLFAAPDYQLTGFATLGGLGRTNTTGGAGGARVHVSTLADLVKYAQTNLPYVIEIMNDVDLSSLANAHDGFPTDYPTGEILVNSNKTIYSKNGATIHRGTLRIGKGPNGKQNIIIRNLKFRDLWVLDPSGNYDTYDWDYVGIEAGSHHIWVDHCDFDLVYDGMVDIKGGSDFVTVSWNIFRNQKKCSLVGHSDNNGSQDRTHLNVTFHHNYYDNVDERMPRMRFGNAHVYNLYCAGLGGKGIQSTAEAATLVENSVFFHPDPGTSPTIESNGGPTGTVKVVNCVIENLPGATVAFRQFGQSNFVFNAPFAGATPPYLYTLDPVEDVPNIVTNFSGVGKIGFELWQMEQFTPMQLTNANISGPNATPVNDGVANLAKYALGLAPFSPAPKTLTPFRVQDGNAILTYTKPTNVTDVGYILQSSPDLLLWSDVNIAHQLVGTTNGMETFEARQAVVENSTRFFRLKFQR